MPDGSTTRAETREGPTGADRRARDEQACDDRMWTEEAGRTRPWGTDLPFTGRETLADVHKPQFLVHWANSNSLPHQVFVRSQWMMHMKVIDQPGSSRKCQSCYDAFAFSGLSICHIEPIFITCSCSSYVLAPFCVEVSQWCVYSLVHLELYQFLCSTIHLCLRLPTHLSLSPLDPCCVPGIRPGSGIQRWIK